MFQVVKRDGELDEFKMGKITAPVMGSQPWAPWTTLESKARPYFRSNSS